ncbi:MAG: hypothetical protein OXU40_01160 [Nitrospira sp.]|nr:hypothetical protein [Nitrospira sp.]
MAKPSAKTFSLDLNDLKSGAYGITAALGECYAQAASVCLEDQGHLSPTMMKVHADTGVSHASIRWDAVDDQMRRSWNDRENATENGAYGIAILVVLKIKHLHVLEQSKKGTGFDYWLGSPDDEDAKFETKARLEVSGIRKGSRALISGRVNQKLDQTKKSDGKHPAVVVVVEFGTPQTHVVDR